MIRLHLTRAVVLAAALAFAASAAAQTPASRPIAGLPDTSRKVWGIVTGGDVSTFWRTRAERTNYRQTADYDETVRYCRQIEAGSRWVKLDWYGRSGQGRDLPLLIVSKDRAFTPEAARALGKPIVLIQNGIHSGEIEGKDATLALVRDLAVLRTKAELLDSVVVLVLPIFSVDAHERRSRYNRINQNGPDEMGWRHTPAGFNLNRDYLKTESPEMRAMIANVYTRWWPDLLVDNHTTNGADYQHDVTYGMPHGPGTPPSIERWLEEAFEGRIVSRLTAMGHLPAPYITFRDGNDPMSGIEFGASSPRYSTGYPPLHGRAALLVETHMLKPYALRVKATYALMVALLEELRAKPRALTQAVREAESWNAGLSTTSDPARRSFALTTRLTDRAVPFAYKGVVTRWEASDITGSRVPRYTSAPWDTIIPLRRELVTALSVRTPVGYVVPQEWTIVAEKLRLHGVSFRKLTRAWRDTVELSRVTGWAPSPRPFEGHFTIDVREVATERQLRAFRPGDLWVPLDQKSAPVAIHLLEARGPDGLLAWNAFDTVLQPKEYAEDYVMEPIARDMMARDPKLAAEFRARVAADTTFAKDPGARIDFFYRRSPWNDVEQNLVPVARALRSPPETVLEPKPGAPIDAPLGRPGR